MTYDTRKHRSLSWIIIILITMMMDTRVNENKHYPIKVIEKQCVNTVRKRMHVEKKEKNSNAIISRLPSPELLRPVVKISTSTTFYLFNTKVNEDIKDAKISRPREGFRRWFIGGR